MSDNPEHYLFPLDDGSRAFNEDHDVRTHQFSNEERNVWIVTSDGQGCFYISSSVSLTTTYLFANDDANLFEDDLDVRIHPH